MMVGLRMLEGVSSEAFIQQFGQPMEEVFHAELLALTQKGLLVKSENGYRISEQALLLGNEVFGAFIGTLTE